MKTLTHELFNFSAPNAVDQPYPTDMYCAYIITGF